MESASPSHVHFPSARSGFALRALAAAVALAAAADARALQPLEQFLAGARSASTANRQAALTAVQRDAEALSTLGGVLPSVSATGTSTHRQFESAMTLQDADGNPRRVVTQSANQLDGTVALRVPLVDAAGWARTAAARATARAAKESVRATLLDVEQQVAQSYYQLVGADALRRSYARSLAAAEENLSLTRTKRAEGAATELDVERAAADAESVRQSAADAELTRALAQRALRTLTGLEPEGEAAEPTDDLHEEPELADWEARARGQVPAVAAAAEQRRSAEATALAAKLSLLPTLGAAGTEYATDAPGLAGHSQYYTATATLSWSFDLSSLAGIRSQRAAADAARVSEESARNGALDALHEAWQRTRTGIVKSRAARVQAKAAALAADLARERYAAGTGTQLEVVQAQRDLVSADAARIQADADLAYARASLRLAAGRSASDAAAPTLSKEGQSR